MNATAASDALFRCANWVVSKRRVTLDDIITGREIVWLAVLSSGFVIQGDCQFELKNFDDFDTVQKSHSLPALGDLRRDGLLVEGSRELPARLVSLLAECAGGFVNIRTSDSTVRTPIGVDEFARVLSTEMDVDELEAIGGNGAWYLRMRDDDALAFIATTSALAQRIVQDCAGTVRLVDGGFIYAA